VYVHSPEQRKLAEEAARREAAEHAGEVVTPIVDFERFWMAEDYHQKYRLKNAREVLAGMEEIYPRHRDLVNSTAAARINGLLAGHRSGDLDELLPELGLPEDAAEALRARVERR